MPSENVTVYDPEVGIVKEPANRHSYRSQIRAPKRFLVKAGSDFLTKNNRLDLEGMHNIIEQLAILQRQGIEIVYVTSGARYAGMYKVGEERAKSMDSRTLCSIGQIELMRHYVDMADIFGITLGQILLEAADFRPEHRTETKEGFQGLFSTGVIAVVNANDPTWKGEVEADNDNLAADIYGLTRADFAIYLSNIPGLMHDYKTGNEEVISVVRGIDSKLYDLVKDENSQRPTGMQAKLQGIEKILKSRGHAVIAGGKKQNIILEILDGLNVGTYFVRNNH